MNKRILEEIGLFVDKNYISSYVIEGYFGFAYLKVTSIEGEEITWEFYLDKDDKVVIEIKE